MTFPFFCLTLILSLRLLFGLKVVVVVGEVHHVDEATVIQGLEDGLQCAAQ